MKVLSIKQPWAMLILLGYKNMNLEVGVLSIVESYTFMHLKSQIGKL